MKRIGIQHPNLKYDVLMDVRDLKAAAIGAALSLVAVLIVYASKIALTHAGENVNSKVSEPGRTDPSTAPRTTNGVSDDLDPAMAANANLADQVRSYQERLEAIGAKKIAIEKQLNRFRLKRDHRKRATCPAIMCG